jgi:hypothetical protein
MNAEWYYVENDITVGPTTLADVAERFGRAEGERCFVWTEGMPDWADATTVPAISKMARSMSARSLSARQTTNSASAIAKKETLG